MEQHPLIGVFPRSTRAIHADSLAPGLAILVMVMALLLAWLVWLLVFQVPFYQTSQAAHVTPEALVVAEFPPAVLPQIQVGQSALFMPGANTMIGNDNPLTATVVEVDREQSQVWLQLTADRETRRRLFPGLSGQIQVVVRTQSPFTLIVEAAGKSLSFGSRTSSNRQPAWLWLS